MTSQGKLQQLLWSFCQLMQKYATGEITSESEIPRVLKWFIHTFQSMPIHEFRYIYIRSLCFWALELLQSKIILLEINNKQEILDLIEKCLYLQPTSDMIPLCMIDLTQWLIVHDGQLIIPDEKITSEVLAIFHAAWDNIYIQPYQKPSDGNLDKLESLVKNPRTSSDTMNQLIKGVRENLKRFLALQHSLPLEQSITDPSIKCLKMKTEQLLRIITGFVERKYVSLCIHPVLDGLSTYILSLYDPDPFSGLLDAAREQKAILQDILKSSIIDDNTSNPPSLYFQKKQHSIIESLQKKRNSQLKRELLVKTISHPVPSTDPFKDALEGNINEYDSDEEDENLLIKVKDIWVEMDPLTNRLINAKNIDFFGLTEQPGVFASEHSGRMHLTTNELQWYGLPKELQTKAIEAKKKQLLSKAMSLPLSSIRSFILEPLNSKRTWAQQLREKDPFSLSVKAMKSLYVDGAKETIMNNFDCLTVTTKEQVFRFFPFNRDQSTFLRTALEECSTVKSNYQEPLVKRILTENLFQQREQILRKLITEENPWIDNYAGISKSVMKITDDLNDEPTNVLMEQLFHSCRLENAVTNETVIILQHYWVISVTETARCNLLRIVDRILDPQVMQKVDPAFCILHQWLLGLERNVNAYKSPLVCMMLLRLIKKCKRMIMQPVTPLVKSHTDSIFENWQQFSSWLTSFNIHLLALDKEKEEKSDV
ncbi:hypothetical protein BC833DRAFT_601180 [Globomyces pollinis-pini]|nr:hypothetical protein BC833DRAFT_601180 [Globomyces pollinis-pini]